MANFSLPLLLENDRGQAKPHSVRHSLTGCSLVRLSLAARNASVPTERVDAVRKLAASLQCPLLFAEDQVCTHLVFGRVKQ